MSTYKEAEWDTPYNAFSLHRFNRRVKTNTPYILKKDPSKQAPRSTISLPQWNHNNTHTICSRHQA
jgi:hypothetical protein